MSDNASSLIGEDAGRSGALHFDAAILDVDGVLTQTARVHERAWAEVLDRVLEANGVRRSFGHVDYREHIDGKPRMEGLLAFLASRGISVSNDKARALAAEKNEAFLRMLRSGPPQRFDDAVAQVERWRERGLGIAFVSASKNAKHVLAAAGIDRLCDVRVDGVTAEERALHGKMAMFLEAARELDARPRHAIVVEDAVSGVEQAAAGGFGLVVGVARRGDEGPELLRHGAQRVVRRLDAGLEDTVPFGTVAPASLPCALADDELRRAIDAHPIALVADFDIVLMPIARLVTELVSALARTMPVALLSAASVDDVLAVLPIERAWIVGRNGREIHAPKGAPPLTPMTMTSRSHSVRHLVAAWAPNTMPIVLAGACEDEEVIRALGSLAIGILAESALRPTRALLRLEGLDEVPRLLASLRTAGGRR